MSSNDLSAVTPVLLAQGMLALRQMATMPRLVNSDYSVQAAEKGATIDVPIPSAIGIQDVVPANIPPSTAAVGPTSVPVPLNQWKEAPFYLTDKDLLVAMDGTIPMQASEAIKSVANYVNTYILQLAGMFYGISGTAGTTPFTPGSGFTGSTWDPRDASNVAAVLNNQLAPIDDLRHVVFNATAEAAALNLRAFNDMSWTGDPDAIIQGKLNQRMGFNWWMNQLVQTWVPGTASGVTLVANTNAADPAYPAYGVGDGNPYPSGYQGSRGDASTVPTGYALYLKASTPGTLLVGDILTFAGDSQTYVVTGPNLGASTSAVGQVAANLVSSGTGVAVYIYPGLQKAQATGALPAVTVVLAQHVMNMAFHRDAIAFATRPLSNVEAGLGSITEVAQDPISGLSLRLEVTREHKRTRYSYDILFGAQVVRRELGARLLG